jgi:hypothetical protein
VWSKEPTCAQNDEPKKQEPAKQRSKQQGKSQDQTRVCPPRRLSKHPPSSAGSGSPRYHSSHLVLLTDFEVRPPCSCAPSLVSGRPTAHCTNCGETNFSGTPEVCLQRKTLACGPTRRSQEHHGTSPCFHHRHSRQTRTPWPPDQQTNRRNDIQVITLLGSQATGLAIAEYDLTVVSLAGKDARATSLPNQDGSPSRLVKKYLDSVAEHKVRHRQSSNLPFHPIVFSLGGGMMSSSTIKVFASWKRVMTRGTYNLMLKRD